MEAEGPASPGRALLCSVKANPEGGAGDAGRWPTARPRDAVEETPTAQTQTGTATATPARAPGAEDDHSILTLPCYLLRSGVKSEKNPGVKSEKNL